MDERRRASNSDDLEHGGLASALSGAQGGDDLGFEEVYHLVAPRIAGYLTARGAGDPEAMANEVMYRVFCNITDFDGTSSQFVSWVFTIAHNLVIDGYRASSRRPPSASTYVPETPVASAESTAIARIENQEVLALVSQLPELQRDVIMMRMMSDMPLSDVALAMDRPVSAIKSLQHRGLRRLARLLAEQD